MGAFGYGAFFSWGILIRGIFLLGHFPCWALFAGIFLCWGIMFGA